MAKKDKFRYEDMKVIFHIKGNDKEYHADNVDDVAEIRAICASRPPVIIWRNEEPEAKSI